MKVLKIIHGYPPLYNAGSEVYSQMLCHYLAERHEVEVFTREENPFAPDFSIRQTTDALKKSIKLNIVNIPTERHRYRYRHNEVDQQFLNVLDRFQPDVIHIGHLNHLAISLLAIIRERQIPCVYTLHDYWLICPRGQFLQRRPKSSSAVWGLCDGQEDKKCAQHCYAGYFSGDESGDSEDISYWKNWVARRRLYIEEVIDTIDIFIAPSRCLFDHYRSTFGFGNNKLIYMDYGFDLDRLQNRKRIQGEPFTFGYIGTHIPAKGVQHLLQAFSQLTGDCQLKIWGRTRPQNTAALKAIAAQFSAETQSHIHWYPEYRNEAIVQDVFNHVDTIVVPSIWLENSPLVIHEALQVRCPVITANVGGMAEYVQHEQNGLLFKHRDVDSLAKQMQRLVDAPESATELGNRAYLQSASGNIISMRDQAHDIEKIYHKLLSEVVA